MAITDTLDSIKDFFLKWHKEDYTKLHEKKTTQVTNEIPDKDLSVTSGAVYDALNNKFNSITTCTVKQCNDDTKTLQTTLDDFDSRLKNKVDKTQYSKADISFWNAGSGTPYVTQIQATNTQDGLMTWKEKIFLQELGTWHTINTGLPPYCSMEVNIALGLVHLHMYAKNITKFKNSTVWEHESDGGQALQQFTPYGHVKTPCSHGYLTIKPSGGFEVKVDKKYEKTVIVADVIWKYTQGQSATDVGSDWGKTKRSIFNNIDTY